ncbi:MAG: hypothetical protein WBH09_02890 [Rugosibacter sp.]
MPSSPALNLAPFGRWTLRDKAAQRRLALRYASLHDGARVFFIVNARRNIYVE